MLGLDAAGKTTILYKLHIGEVLSTVPTIGMLLIPLIDYFFVAFLIELILYLDFKDALPGARGLAVCRRGRNLPSFYSLSSAASGDHEFCPYHYLLLIRKSLRICSLC
jgi:hypothetical protein